MVYCGKPSGGCSTCRRRKIRCDQKEPACTQCEKKNQPCPGYRNLVDLMFRDESSHVIKKAVKTRARSNQSQKSPVYQELASASTSPPPSVVTIKSPPTFAIDPRSSAAPAPATKTEKSNKVKARRARKSNTRCRAPVLSALINDWSRSPSETSHESPSDASDVIGLSEPTEGRDHLDDALSPELQDKGTAFFFSRFVAADRGSYQNYAFIYDVWKPPDSAQAQVDPVTVSMTAVGLAGCSQVFRSPDLMTRAQESYAIALGLTHRALRDPIEVVKDTTMLAVLILGTFEFVSGYSSHTMRAWQDHVNGAAALANIRGAAQFRSKAGAHLRHEIPPSEELGGPDFHVAYPIYKALQVRYDINTRKLVDLDDAVAAISNVEEEFSSILSGLPESWKYHRVQLTQPDPRVSGQICHVYAGLLQSTTWNMVRGIRMMLLETLVEQLCAAAGSADHTVLSDNHFQLLAKSLKVLDMLGQSIAASVPQHLGVVSIRDINKKDQGHTVSIAAKKQACRVISSPFAQDSRVGPGEDTSSSGGSPVLFDPTQSTPHTDDATRFMSLASANNTIIWPLYMLGMSSACSSETKQYAIEGLQAIHREAGLEQARVVAGLLQEKDNPLTLSPSLLSKLPTVDANALPSTV
ncbi:negative acting factor [Fusarium pseudocircinatum]|uniref:Negative acting factor n=1 Tax=Fusarium pseudocircinatum TaxID=56676 RepID=A0A8H5P6J4_9HYPO|nr:negative acting factor [Fusarium pseudocircinatum]